MRATLIEASLQDAKLVGANLIEANLLRSDLSGADLQGALLAWTNLAGANVDGANFFEAVFSTTILAGLDLRKVRNLEAAGHLAPSSIGIDTVFQSKGIPAVFLRGCGVPEELIAYLPSIFNQAIEFYSCFISYSHTDKQCALRLYAALQSAGIRCWLDERQLRPGDDIHEHVDRGIRLWDKVLLGCSESSLTSWWVDSEIAIALDKELQLTKERGQKIQAIIPLNLDGYVFSDKWNSGYRAQIRRRLAADFTGWENDSQKFNNEVESVISALRSDEGAREKPPEAKL